MKTLNFKLIILLILMGSILMIGTAHSSVNIGEKVPTVTLRSVEGGSYNLADYIGKKITIIWVSDLGPPSNLAADDFLELYLRYSKKGISFFIISTVEKKKSESFLMNNNIPCPVLLGGNDAVTRALTGESGKGINPVNNFFIIDKSGVLRNRYHMPGLPSKQLEKIINKLVE